MTTKYIKNEKDASKVQAKKGQRLTKCPAGDGLFLYINAGGKKVWAREYKFNGVSDVLRFGIYPTIAVKEAKERNARISVDLLNGIHPKATTLKKANDMPTLDQFFVKFKQYKIDEKQWTSNVTIKKNEQLFHKYFSKKLGKLPLNQIDIELLKPVFRGLKKTPENQDKMRTLVKTLFDLAVDENLVKTNPMLFLPKTIISRSPNNNYKHVTSEFELKDILIKIKNMSRISYVVHSALKIAPHLFLRPQELLSIQWSDISWTENFIAIRQEVNKTRKDLIVPMSSQVKAMILDLKPINGHKTYVFSTQYGDMDQPISTNALGKALTNNDINNINPHGFRHTASTFLNEMGFDADAIELQLGHTIKNTRGVYNKAQKLALRMDLMQQWSNYLNSLVDYSKTLEISDYLLKESA